MQHTKIFFQQKINSVIFLCKVVRGVAWLFKCRTSVDAESMSESVPCRLTGKRFLVLVSLWQGILGIAVNTDAAMLTIQGYMVTVVTIVSVRIWKYSARFGPRD